MTINEIINDITNEIINEITNEITNVSTNNEVTQCQHRVNISASNHFDKQRNFLPS